jgi:ubiquinone/menaquinone biosynthesis C-methylase UbiE
VEYDRTMHPESDGQRSAREYDAIAEPYSAHNAQSPFNAYYERPTMINLLGDVEGQRVLDVGCGSGQLTEWLVGHGATVTGIDVSPRMLELARQRVGSRARLMVADAAAPLSFADDASFDVIVASLVLHYVRDWDRVFREFRRLLTPVGRVLFSTHHPTMDARLYSPEDYFATTQVTDFWEDAGHRYDVTFWRRPLTAMTHAIAAAGFVVVDLVEPPPAPELVARDANAFARLRTQPAFLFFHLRRDTL